MGAPPSRETPGILEVFVDGRVGRVANAVEILQRRAPGIWTLGFSGGEVKEHWFDGLREGFPAIDLELLYNSWTEPHPLQLRRLGSCSLPGRSPAC